MGLLDLIDEFGFFLVGNPSLFPLAITLISALLVGLFWERDRYRYLRVLFSYNRVLTLSAVLASGFAWGMWWSLTS